MADITGEVLRGRYQIERLLGRGGMADVYLAFDMHRHTHVALKLIREDLADDADFIRRFSREAAALARLDHPNVVRFYSTEQDGSLAFIVMDYVPGSTLQRRISQVGGPMSVAETTSLMHQIGPALHYAHSLGFIHRDIKPGNIMLREDGTALLSDFGAARVSESATLASLTIGTPAYMSPEQILGKDLTAQSDIYSFGLVIYEMLAGRRAFTGDEAGLTGTGTISRLREAHLRLDPRNPAEFNREVTPALADVVLKSLAKDLAIRWPTMVSFMDAWDGVVGKPGRRPSGKAPGTTALAGAAAFESAETVAGPMPTGDFGGPTVAQPTGAATQAGPLTAAAVSSATVPPAAGAMSSGTGAPPPAQPAQKRSRGPVIAGAILVALILVGIALWRFVLPGMATAGTASEVQVGAGTATAQAVATQNAVAAQATLEANNSARVALDQRAAQVATAEAAATAAAVQLQQTASVAGRVVEQAAAIAATATAEALATQEMAPKLTATAVAAATSQAAGAAATATASAEAEAAAATATAAVTPTPTPTAGKAPTRTPLPLAAATAAPSQPGQPGIVTDFESNATWQVGDQKYGTLQRSTEQAHSGSYSAKISYDFPAVAGNFVVFNARPAIPLPGKPTGLSAWVYGDGSGNFLNAWLRDSAGEVRQYTFGQVSHTGWQQMTAWFDDARGWPNVRISGADNGKLDLPASLVAIVLDGVPDGQASKGAIYIDSLGTVTDAVPTGESQSAPAAGGNSSAAPETAPAALSGKIAVPVFAADRGTYDLLVGPASGSVDRVQAGASQPALSPNGAFVAFRGWQGARGIDVMQALGGGRRQLTTFYEDGLPSWSPDGSQIVFSSRRESDRKSRLYQVPAAGGGDFVMKQGESAIYGEFPTWLADGSIVYRSTFPVQGLVVIASDGSNPSTLVSDASATAPAGSPRSAVAFMSLRDGNYEIYKVNRDGTGLARLTNNAANDGLPAWSPDGGSIAFVSDRDGSWGVWVMAADGSGQRKLFALPGSIDGRVAGEPDYSSRGWTEERLSWSR